MNEHGGGALVLSIFPGIGILDRAFEEQGFTIVRGPDLLWGGDVRRFHPPAGRFEGVLGGPPCQAHSSLVPLIRARGGTVAPDLIPEFERIVGEAQPAWFLMENTKRAPLPKVPGYEVHGPMFDNRWIGGEQQRPHRFSFGTRDGRRLDFGAEDRCLDNPAWARRVMASGGYTPRVLVGGNGSPKRDAAEKVIRKGTGGRLPRSPQAKSSTRSSAAYFAEAKRLQGLPADFDLPGFTAEAKIRVLGDAVPLPMGRALARAVLRALGRPQLSQGQEDDHVPLR